MALLSMLSHLGELLKSKQLVAPHSRPPFILQGPSG